MSRKIELYAISMNMDDEEYNVDVDLSMLEELGVDIEKFANELDMEVLRLGTIEFKRALRVSLPEGDEQ